MEFKAIDLFSGAGGLTMGLKQAGFKVIAAVEFNPEAAASYVLNHRKTKMYLADICLLDPYEVMSDLKMKVGELDLLAGCPPCQGFSTHRTRRKILAVEDKRNDLIFKFMDYVRAFLPKTILVENVPALSTDVRMLKVLQELQELGFWIDEDSGKVENASQYGVPQRRKRMVLRASRFGKIPEPAVLNKNITVREAIGHLPIAGQSGDVLHDYPENRTSKVQDIIKMIPKNGGSRRELPREYWLPCHLKRPNSYNDVYGRMRWDDVAPTMTGGCTNPSKGRFLHPEENRAITMREAAILQSFPDNYQFCLDKGKDSVSLMIGNAIPPRLIKVHAGEFKRHLLGI